MNGTRKRIKIGVVIDAVHEQYQAGIWRGISKRANELQIDLLSFIGTSQDGVDHFDTQYDVIQAFAPKSDIDGVIVFTGSITEHHGRDFTKSFCKLFSGIPLVCVSEKIPGFPSIVVENAPGIEQLIDHFVTIHNLRSIAFIKGPNGHEEAEERFAAYKRGLERNSIVFNPDLVFDGSFISRDGAQAVKDLIAKDIFFDGILAVNDHTALGVLEELSRHKKHVPGMVSVAGFDDVKEASMVQPTLSTIRQPLFLMGLAAVDNILDQINGVTPEMETLLPTEPVYRRSCGCFSYEVENAKAIHCHIDNRNQEEVIDSIYSQSLHYVNRRSPHYPGDDEFRTLVKNLIEALIWDVSKPSIRHIFLNEIDMLLFHTSKYSHSISLLQAILKEVTVYVSSLFSDTQQLTEANNIFQQAVALVQEHRSVLEKRWLLDEKSFQHHINVVSQRIISSFEQRELLESIAKGLPKLGIESLALTIFEQENINRSHWTFHEECNLLLAYNSALDKVIYPRGVTKIKSTEIFPNQLTYPNRAHNQIFMPLYHRDEYLGYIVLEFSDSAPFSIYEEIRSHVSSAIKSSLLLRKFKAQSILDELTNVYNRRGFVSLGSKMLLTAHGNKQELVMFYADVDGLKTINDQYGHADGDIVINGAARILCDTFRERDLIARIGGDEFVVALICSHEHLDGLEEKIRDRFSKVESQFNKTLNKPYKLSVSLGIAVCDMKNEESLEKLMKRADADLFSKKRARKLSLPS